MQAHSKPASTADFNWYHSDGDDVPLAPCVAADTMAGQTEAGGRAADSYSEQGRSRRAGRGGKMAEVLQFEKADEHGNPIKRLILHPPRLPPAKQCADTTPVVVVSSEDDDHNYKDPGPLEHGSTSSTESESQSMLPSNAEV
ncbi:hypothetical protein JOM56_000661 [Amanita muscaria]